MFVSLLSLLDPVNDADLFCLHYVFIPRINATIQCFQSAWNNHPLSTEGNRSPLQLYTAHSVESTLFEKPSADILLYGDDPEAPTPECDDDGATVTVPEIDLPLSQYSLDVLEVTINPMQECDDYGLQLYMDSVHLVHQLTQDNQLID